MLLETGVVQQLAGPRGPRARLAARARQQGSLLLLLLLLRCCRMRSSCSWLGCWQLWRACRLRWAVSAAVLVEGRGVVSCGFSLHCKCYEHPQQSIVSTCDSDCFAV
jgi:hypothetical protein